MRHLLHWHLSRFDGFVGFNNHMGSKFTTDADGMAIVMDVAAELGLLFLDSRTTAETVGVATATEAQVPFIERDVFLDNVIDRAEIDRQLDRAAAIARTTGAAVMIGHPHPETIQALQDWLRGLDDIEIVPLSALVKRQQADTKLAQR